MKRSLFTTSLAVGALAAGCGGSGGDPDADPASAVPARAPVYLEATINPDGETSGEIKALAEKLAGTSDPGGDLKRLFERSVNEGGGDFKWDEDVEPWVGDRIGVFVSSISGSGDDADAALVLPTEDPDKAKESLEKALSEREPGDAAPKVGERTYRDVKYKVDSANDVAVAIVGDYALNGTERAVKAGIDAQEGEGLAETDAFKSARDQVEDSAVGFGYVRMSALLSSLGPQGAALRPALSRSGDTLAFALDTDKDAIRVESAALGAKEGGSGDPGKLIAQLPGDAWLAGGTADIGGQLEQSLEQFAQLGALAGTDLDTALAQIEQQTGIDVREDLISWMGDGAVFVRGSSVSDLNGALVVQSKDAAKTREVIGRLGRLARQLPGTTVRGLSQDGVDEGLTLRSAQLPLPVHVAAAGDRFIVAVTDAGLEGAIEAPQKLGDAPAFKEAAGRLDEGIKPSLFVDMEPLRGLVEESGAADRTPDAEKARRALEALSTIVAGGKRDGDVQRGDLVVGVK